MPLSKALDRRAFFQGATATVSLVLAGATVALADNPKSGRNPALEWKEPEITQKAYIDISIADKPEGRLVIALYGNVVPETVKNFVALLKGDSLDGSSYKGTEAYRVLDGLNIQMGAIGSRSGKSGKSATGESFGPENFEILHMKEGLLSMVRNDEAKNDSRFFISVMDDAGWADDRYPAFGRIIEGMDVMHKIERVKVEGRTNKPKTPVVIVDCGLL